MDAKTIAAVLAALTGTTPLLACDRAKSTVTPTEAPPAESEGEHACGNHAEGACGGEAAPAPASARTFAIEPGKFAEANFEMSAGSTVTATFERGSAGIAWDVHSHGAAHETTIHAQGTGASGKVEFTAPADGVFSILWKNTGATPTPLDVTIELGEGAKLHSWMPE